MNEPNNQQEHEQWSEASKKKMFFGFILICIAGVGDLILSNAFSPGIGALVGLLILLVAAMFAVSGFSQ